MAWTPGTPYTVVTSSEGGHLSPKPLVRHRRNWCFAFSKHVFILAGALFACLAPTVGFLVALKHFSNRVDVENEIDREYTQRVCKSVGSDIT